MAEFVYKTTNYYHPESDRGIIWNDADISISWPNIGPYLLSEKDRNQPLFSLAEIFMD